MKLVFLVLLLIPVGVYAQLPPIDSGVSQELAKWRSARYSDIRYKLDLTLEKMSPVLKGHMEIRVKVAEPKPQPTPTPVRQPDDPPLPAPMPPRPFSPWDTPIILDWRRLPGHEKDSTISNLTVNGLKLPPGPREGDSLTRYVDGNDHLIIDTGVHEGENVITLDFTSPILTSGSAITRYIDKEDGSEYIYSLFVPSDASTAFPVFDQPDLKARFELNLNTPREWQSISNTEISSQIISENSHGLQPAAPFENRFYATQPLSTYVFAFATGPFAKFSECPTYNGVSRDQAAQCLEIAKYPAAERKWSKVYVRKSQAAKFQQHAAETFRLTREAIKYLETYFDYKFPWPKYDLVLIPEFPFGGMEHAGATFLRESSVIFPTEPTKGDEISRANVIFHETAHQWFGDLVTMRWFDDLWLKEGFAEFMAYKTLEHVMPDANAWKVFYERNKQAAYATDSTRGTTPIYQKIDNLSAAKSAYGNIVYRKAPSFLRQAEFYLGPDKFQTAVRAFLKKHEYANAGWEDLVGEFEAASGQRLKDWATTWVTVRGLPTIRTRLLASGNGSFTYSLDQTGGGAWKQRFQMFQQFASGTKNTDRYAMASPGANTTTVADLDRNAPILLFPNYGDYGYGIFLLDDRSRDYVLKHIGEEKDPFLRSMMWGALWDSVREAELDPREYVELAIKQLPTEPDETTTASLLGRTSTALNYYLDAATRDRIAPQLEAILLDRMQHAATAGQRITFYRAFVSNASTEHGRTVLKQMLGQASGPQKNHPVGETPTPLLRKEGSQSPGTQLQLRTKDKFDIVTRLIVLGDPDAARLLAELEKAETSDDAKRYAYAAIAGFPEKVSKDKYFYDFLNNKEIPESWIEAAIGPFNSIRYPELSQPYLERALKELPSLKRTRKIFFVNNWLGAWLSGQRDEKALAIVNKFLADNPNLDDDLRLKVLENVDVIERAVKIRARWNKDVTAK